MDSLTHIVIGACIGEVMLENQVGKKAILWGILAHSLPDLDFIASLWMSPPEALLAHRGFTHSFLFAALVIPFLSLIASKIHGELEFSFRKWNLFFGVSIAAHLFIDVFNNYGIGWLEPFSYHRYAYNWIYVVDPFFTLVPMVVLFLLLFFNKQHSSRKKMAWIGLLFPFFYLSYCGVNKLFVTQKIQSSKAYQSLAVKTNIYITPAPLQSWLWYVIVVTDAGFYTGYVSVFDNNNHIVFNKVEEENRLVKKISNQTDLKLLIRFSQGFYAIQQQQRQIVFNDMRFGQVQGWSDTSAPFVFQYKLQQASPDKMLLQRGRLSGWNNVTFQKYLKRIAGE